MNTKNTYKFFLVAGCVVVVVLLAAFGLVSKPNPPPRADNILSLQAPSFVSVARADIGSIASFLDEEAGIAAYTQTAGSIDLSTMRGEFRTIERETAEYIIGSVGIPDYSEDHDPHVYVHTDGWVLAYYLNSEPASYIMDLRHYDGVEIGTTKLEDAIYEILSAIGVVTFDATFYDFRYPNATNIMLIAEAIYTYGDESFDVHLPSDFTYYDKSWSHARDDGYTSSSRLYLDETEISYLTSGYYQWLFAHGNFTPAQLPPGVSHTIRLNSSNSNNDAFCSMALVYQEVP